MDREPAGDDDAGWRAPGRAPSPQRRLVVAGLAAGMVLLLVIAVLATRLASVPAAQSAAVTATPAPTATATAPLTAATIYQRAAPSVVLIRAGHDLGTGVIVADDGTILTADHVVAGGGSITVTFADGTVASASVLSSDKKTDIAELSPVKLPKVVVPATLGGAADVGAPVVAIGNPLGLTDSVSAGVVSGLNRTANTDTGKRSGLIQFDAAVNPGSSGGPLLDSRGMVIGIVVALADPDGQDAFAGIGFAVPIGSALGNTGSGQGKGPQI
jgi:S1-C subfamily serine protease